MCLLGPKEALLEKKVPKKALLRKRKPKKVKMYLGELEKAKI